MQWKKILCPTDFSDGAVEALRTAVAMAKGSDAEIVVVHVWNAPVYFASESIGLPASMLADLFATAQSGLAQVRQSAESQGASRVSTRLLQGAPWNEIVEIARADPEIEVIVVGTHGRTGLAHVLIGSVAERIVRHATCPVLVVRAR